MVLGQRVLLVGAALAVAACLPVSHPAPDGGPGGTGGTTVGGTVGGTGFNARDAQLVRTPIAPGWAVPEVMLSDHDELCADLQANVLRASGRVLQLMLLSGATTPADAPPVAAGTYSVGTSTGLFCIGTHDCDFQAVAVLLTLDESCAVLGLDGGGAGTGVVADDGEVAVQEVDAKHASGSFEVHFGADILSGTFNAGWCQPSGPLPGATCR